MLRSLVGSEMCIRDRPRTVSLSEPAPSVGKLALPLESMVQLDAEGDLCGSINGTSISGDNLHLVFQRTPDNRVIELESVPTPTASIPEPLGEPSNAPEVAIEVPTWLADEPTADGQLGAITRVLTDTILQTGGIQVDPFTPLMQAGLKSAQMVKIAQAIGAKLDVLLSPVDILNYPTVSKLSQYIGEILGLVAQTTNVLRPSHTHTDRAAGSSLVITQLHSEIRAPAVRDIAQWYARLMGAQDCSQSLPGRVGSAEQGYRGHFMSGVELFDSEFFHMSEAEVRATDPNHRVLLEVAGSALLSTPTAGRPGVGVFLGICNVTDWIHVQRDSQTRIGTYTGHGVDGGAAAGRVSYLFGLQGPCFSVNTACSSSLVALDAARLNLEVHACESALVAGVCVHLHPSSFQVFCALHALAPDGRCKTFDARADGYARSEACGAVLIEKSTSSTTGAVEVSGTAVNQDGRSASFMAPNGPSQEVVIKAAMRVAQLNQLDVSEAHGTGTALGDPIEVGSLRRVHVVSPPVLLAVKSQIAHTEGAAGIAGLLKAATTIQSGMAPPNIHLQQANPKIDLRRFGITMPAHPMLATLRSTGVSSFGYSGTNSHATLRRAPESLSDPGLSNLNRACYKQVAYSWYAPNSPEPSGEVAVGFNIFQGLKQPAGRKQVPSAPTVPSASAISILDGALGVDVTLESIDSLQMVELLSMLSDSGYDVSVETLRGFSCIQDLREYFATLPVPQGGQASRGRQYPFEAFISTIVDPDAVEGLVSCWREGAPGRDPIIVVYAAAGVSYGSGIMKYFDESQPVYCTQNPEFTTKLRFDSLEERSEHHANIIEEMFAGKCVHFIGYSAGGALATTIASKLAPYCTLTLFDPVPAVLLADRLTAPDPLLDRAKSLDIVASFVGEDPHLRDRVLDKSITDQFHLGLEVYDMCSHKTMTTDTLLFMAEYFASSAAEFHAHQLLPCFATKVPLDVKVIIAKDGLDWFVDHSPFQPDLKQTRDGAHGWSGKFASVETTLVEGDHLSIWEFEENVQLLAEHLNALTGTTP
eukprot:TRINITY_DN5912_c0_g1_i3.p1 TRINITY_DN5912_c0_g1~~TRINITY_DN5912_c0_g1_i3.p1  ORF type:complete len:1078 (-),score=146.22 TRINITY_DN5912_c0_g1_i3:206-3331(-)